MRPIERIKPFMKWLTNEWLQSPDQRFGQFLINLGLVEDSMYTWHNEMGSYPIPHEVIREIQCWGKKGGIITHKQIYIKDMEFDHIVAILETQEHIPEYLRTILEVELSWRLSNE